MSLHVLAYFSYTYFFIIGATISSIEPSSGGTGGDVKVTIYGSGKFLYFISSFFMLFCFY
jgi:hypothetical protein